MTGRHTVSAAGTRRRAAAPLVAVATLVVTTLVSGCQGGSGGARPSITASPSRSVTASLPALSTSPDRTLAPSRTGTASPPDQASTPQPSSESVTASSPGPVTTAATSTVTATRTATERETVTRTAEASGDSSSAVAVGPTSSPASTTGAPATSAAAESGDSGGGSTALWVALLVLLALAVVGIALWLRRRSARQRWQGGFTAAVSDTGEVARAVGPVLATGTPEGRAGAWQVSRPKVVVLEEQLANLARTAPDPEGSASAGRLQAALAGVREAMDTDQAVGASGADAPARAQEALRHLESELAALEARQPV